MLFLLLNVLVIKKLVFSFKASHINSEFSMGKGIFFEIVGSLWKAGKGVRMVGAPLEVPAVVIIMKLEKKSTVRKKGV